MTWWKGVESVGAAGSGGHWSMDAWPRFKPLVLATFSLDVHTLCCYVKPIRLMNLILGLFGLVMGNVVKSRELAFSPSTCSSSRKIHSHSQRVQSQRSAAFLTLLSVPKSPPFYWERPGSMVRTRAKTPVVIIRLTSLKAYVSGCLRQLNGSNIRISLTFSLIPATLGLTDWKLDDSIKIWAELKPSLNFCLPGVIGVWWRDHVICSKKIDSDFNYWFETEVETETEREIMKQRDKKKERYIR